MSGLVKRSITISRHRTSIALEKEFWIILEEIAEKRALPLASLIIEIDSKRDPDQGLASALRIATLNDVLRRLTLSSSPNK
ncbi:aryl-sulfate sulfotransferase [Aristophania vespae]|uniref:Aryl-sulfate sulfotransferase n=1 Tax=Aristophania vespae TaxID=2697033 RepID=A0A6P1NC89_9PROT|nr:ribbon-helix-helix domain-containing protein [Aristophania vespae]QHI95946.1 aryl-sulfate sulfotransferase [Aristophania vespae]UMM63689.1 hypothetical protein DM15PD_06630 [Aristophania vespae]